MRRDGLLPKGARGHPTQPHAATRAELRAKLGWQVQSLLVPIVSWPVLF